MYELLKRYFNESFMRYIVEKRNGQLVISRNGEIIDHEKGGISRLKDEQTTNSMQTISEANGGINNALLETVQRIDKALEGKVDCDVDFIDQSEFTHDRKNDVVMIRRNVKFTLRKVGITGM
ncbi:MAG: hypothetical protein R3B91_23575 [Planctomycetaceae bacterium]